MWVIEESKNCCRSLSPTPRIIAQSRFCIDFRRLNSVHVQCLPHGLNRCSAGLDKGGPLPVHHRPHLQILTDSPGPGVLSKYSICHSLRSLSLHQNDLWPPWDSSLLPKSHGQGVGHSAGLCSSLYRWHPSFHSLLGEHLQWVFFSRLHEAGLTANEKELVGLLPSVILQLLHW